MNIQIGAIGHIIQLAIAPVFLLTGVGAKLIVLTNQLARIVDRFRRCPSATRLTCRSTNTSPACARPQP
jgi:hypothetical protein